MKREYLTVTYEIEDGYAGGARPQHVNIPIEEIHECETLGDAIKLVEDYIQAHFQEKTYPSYDIDDAVEKCWSQREGGAV